MAPPSAPQPNPLPASTAPTGHAAHALNPSTNQSGVAALDAARQAVVMEVKDAAAGVRTSLATQSPAQLVQQLDAANERLFVSPRVVDERAFEQLASTLRSLTSEAAAQAKSLTQASAGVQMLTDNLRALTKDIATRTEQAAKLLPTLESRVASAQSLVDRVTRDAAIAKAREVRDAIASEIQSQTQASLQAALSEQLPSMQAQFVQAAKDALMATPLPADIAELAREQAQAHVHKEIEAAVREAVREAMATLRTDVADTVRPLFPQAAAGVQSQGTLAGQASAPLGAPDLAKTEAACAALDAATTRATATAQQLETTVEAVAGEIAQQLAALRSDASVIIGGATARIEGLANSAAEHAAERALAEIQTRTRDQELAQGKARSQELRELHEQKALAKAELLAELQRHIGEILEPEMARQEAATIEAIQTAQHAAHESVATLVAAAEEGARTAAERLGQAIVEARSVASALHTTTPTTNFAVRTDVAKPNVPEAELVQTRLVQTDLARTMEQGQSLLTTLSDRIEAAAHAADVIQAQLQAAASTAANGPQNAPRGTSPNAERAAATTWAGTAPTTVIAPGGATASDIAPLLSQAHAAIAHLTTLLTHAAQAGPYLQRLLLDAGSAGISKGR